jgi:hypothetical protein
MRGMFNGAPVVTHETAAFVEAVEGERFGGISLATEMLSNVEISLTQATSRIYKTGEQFMEWVRPVLSDV